MGCDARTKNKFIGRFGVRHIAIKKYIAGYVLDSVDYTCKRSIQLDGFEWERTDIYTKMYGTGTQEPYTIVRQPEDFVRVDNIASTAITSPIGYNPFAYAQAPLPMQQLVLPIKNPATEDIFVLCSWIYKSGNVDGTNCIYSCNVDGILEEINAGKCVQYGFIA